MITGYSEDQKVVAIMALVINQGDYRATAEALGISHMTLYRWDQKLGTQVRKKLIGMKPEEMQGYIQRFHEMTGPKSETVLLVEKPRSGEPEDSEETPKESEETPEGEALVPEIDYKQVSLETLIDENRRSIYTAIQIREKGIKRMRKLMNECEDVRSLAYAVSILNETIKSGLPAPQPEENPSDRMNQGILGISKTLANMTEKMLENARNQNQKS